MTMQCLPDDDPAIIPDAVVHRWRRDVLIILGGAAAALVAAGALSWARAHQAVAGWTYDGACCSGRDCALAVPGTVREVHGGYAVRVAPGTHPMVPLGADVVEEFVAHGDARIRVSGDEYRHVCVGQYSRRVLCIYVPPGGV